MFYSQYKQDEILEKNIFKGYKNGFFVDVGANDGIKINNTLYFEKNNGWNGINIEANSDVFNLLIKNRPNNININVAVCNENGSTEFIKNTGYTEMISGIKNNYDNRHLQRLNDENIKYNSTTEIININTKRLENIFDENNINNINYLSIDVEGAEFEVIKSINFDKVFIDVIEFENNYDDTSKPIIEFLESKDFIIYDKQKDIFMINKKSEFFITKNLLFIGSSNMSEIEFYSKTYNNGVFIEANDETIQNLQNNLDMSNKKYDTNFIALNYLITSDNNKEYDFNVFTNKGSSSIYKKDNDKWIWNQNIKEDYCKKLTSIRLDSLLTEKNIFINKTFDVVIDVQGAELEVLKSFGKFLNYINCVQLESNADKFYKNQSTIYEIDKFLIDNNFVLINGTNNTIDCIKKIGQGDLIYARNKNIKTIFKNYQE
jgi:FkbM family methyltransferase